MTTTSQAKLQQAMERLLAGRPEHTDGRLIKENLYREAGVSRATMNRHPALLKEWNARVDTPTPRDRARRTLETEVANQRTTINELRAHVRELEGQLTTAATVIAELTVENQHLRQHQGAVVPIRRTHL